MHCPEAALLVLGQALPGIAILAFNSVVDHLGLGLHAASGILVVDCTL